ncbi:nucleoside 2-deoxyribosyltransferase [Aerococcus urinaeequi]|uniref:Nucleoside 2-deoxyribosyltransferase n=1 Tax=Aerococcus viridans TaxID=1377 RepID=A0A2N6UE00_9LACT|nr:MULTISPECIES: nucleoside 2-deoxyribosyltransferase [Aerococcus]OFU49878.1 nucleoside 2-deoxyribosyltransferase [Aerococcus sp. HMSC10H05]PMC79777.1 nucleoside 2-deoxyribosyltransferase [Aerococcus viridans]
MDKRKDISASTKLYLATPFFNPDQVRRVEEATKALNANPTVDVVHFPFDHQYKDTSFDRDPEGIFGSFEWQVATYQNDLSAMNTADAGVFLYDVENVDDGTAFELGFMRAMHKPAIVVLLSENGLEGKELNLMIARGGTYFMTDINELATYDFNHFPTNPLPDMDVI